MKTKADKLELIKAAMGEIPCDKTIVNVRHVNVFTGEILKAEVDIYKGYVISVRTGNEPSLQKAKEIIDGEGLYMIPGYVDTHMHINRRCCYRKTLPASRFPGAPPASITILTRSAMS